MEFEEAKKLVLSRTPKKVLTKDEYYALSDEGFFGNKALTWKSYGEILKSGWKDGICLRSKKGIDRRIQQDYVNRRVEEIPKCIEEWVKQFDVPEEMIVFNQSMPDSELLVQGELLREGELYCFHYSTVKEPMNAALRKRPRDLIGFGEVEEILRQNLVEESYNDLRKLLEEYPESVVEFSAYSIPVGTLAKTGRNTVFWEVRNY